MPERFQAGVAQTTRECDGEFSRKCLFLLDVSYWFQILVAAAQLGRESPVVPTSPRFCIDEGESNRALRSAKPWQAGGKTVAEDHTQQACRSRVRPYSERGRAGLVANGSMVTERLVGPLEGGTHYSSVILMRRGRAGALEGANGANICLRLALASGISALPETWPSG